MGKIRYSSGHENPYDVGFAKGSHNKEQISKKGIGAILRNEDRYNPSSSEDDKDVVRGFSDGLLKKASKVDNISAKLKYILQAARAKAVIGEPSEKVNRDLKFLLGDLKSRKDFNSSYISSLVASAERFLDTGEPRIQRGGIENKVFNSIFLMLILAGLFFGISTMTGNVVGISSNSSGFLGAVLFVGGIVGLFFSKK